MQKNINSKNTTSSLDYLITSRPTAVNMADAAVKIKNFYLAQQNDTSDAKIMKEKLVYH